MGVITTVDIEAGQTFGPIPTTVTLTNPAFLIGQMTCDKCPDVHTVKVDISKLIEGDSAKEWLPYIQPARDESEQNIEAFMRDGEFYYRALRAIPACTELLVWYSDECARSLAIPEIQPLHFQGGIFTCPFCRKTFSYPFSLRAHMRFKCENRLKLNTDKLSNKAGFIPTDPAAVDAAKLFSFKSYEYLTNNFNRANSNLWASYSHYLSGGKSPSELSQTRGMSSPSSTTSSSSHNSDLLSPTMDKSDVSVWSRVQTSAEKRHLQDEDLSNSPKRQTNESNRPRSSDSDTLSKIDQNQNISVDAHEDDEGLSAFRKVEKGSPTLPTPAVLSRTQSSEVTRSPASSIFSPTPINMSPPAESSYLRKERIPTSSGNMTPLLNRFPALPGNGLRSSVLPRMYNENVPVRVSDMYRGTMKPNDMLTSSDKLTDIRNLEKGDIKQKLQRMQDQCWQYQYMKTLNPVIGPTVAAASIPLNYNSFNVTQNWCAKCNASFRMTSDLVYHMRSHHKREFDPIKKKREEKLRCQVCNESFRERHHLTRHMTSHV